MTFLAPTAGLLAAAIAGPLLVALYLLKLRRRPARVSSTLLWEQAVRDLEVNVPFRRLRLSAAFLLHLLATAALVLAIARPAWEGLSTSQGRVLIVLDRSASMSARLPDGSSRLDAARARAIDLVSSLTRSTAGFTAAPDITVAQFASSAEILTSPSRNRETLVEALGAITPTDQPGDQNALARVLAAFASPAESGGPPSTAYILSDGGPIDHESRTVLSGVLVEFIPIPASAPARSLQNLGITAIDARRDPDDPASVRLFVRVLLAPAPAADTPRPADTTVRVLIDGEPAGVISLPLPPGGTDATATTLLPVPRGAIITASLPSGDALPADDSAYLVLPPPSLPRVVVVAPALPATTPETAADAFLKAVLRGLDLAWLRFADPASAWSLLSAGEASPDLVIFDRVRPTALPRIPSISLGAGVPVAGLDLQPPAPDARPSPSRILAWDRQHPILRHVPLDTVSVESASRLRFTPGPRSPSQAFATLAEGPDGPLIGLLDDAGIPRVVVAFEQAAANWGPSPAFPVFIANAIDFLTLRAQAANGRWSRTTSLNLIDASPEARAVSLRGPLDRTIPRPPPPPADSPPAPPDAPWKAELGSLPRVGLYRVEGAAAGPAAALAINLCHAGESSLVTRDTFPITGEPPPPLDGPAPPVPGELWPWLVLLALIALTLEWLHTAWRMRV